MDFSRAEIRVLAVARGEPGETSQRETCGVRAGERLMLEWGRRWWEPQMEGGAALPVPTYKRVHMSDEEYSEADSSTDNDNDELSDDANERSDIGRTYRPL